MPLSADSANVLAQVKESGKPCRFVMISKGAKILSVVAFRRGSDDSRVREAKEAGSGQVACGVVDGKGASLSFKLQRSDGYESAPVKDSVLKDFLNEGTKLNSKPTIAIVDELPAVEMEVDGSQRPPQTSGPLTPQTGSQPTPSNQQQPTPTLPYHTNEEWKAELAKIQNASDKIEQRTLFAQTVRRYKEETDRVKLDLQSNSQSPAALAQETTLAKVGDILKKLNSALAMPQAPQLPPRPTQPQPPQVNPRLARQQAKWNDAQLAAQAATKATNGAKACLADPFSGADLDQLATTARQAAEATRVGVSKDKTLIAISEGLATAQQHAAQGRFAEAHAKLLELQDQHKTGKAAEEKERKGAILGPTKHIHNERLAEYDKLEQVFNAAVAKIGSAASEVTHTGNELCKAVRAMLAEYQQGKADALNPRLVNNLEAFLKTPGLSDTVADVGKKLVQGARTAIDAEYKKRLSGATTAQLKAELFLELGSCPGSADRKSNEKGKSDSFFLKGPDGQLQYVMKPMQGESLTSADWEPGGGPVREILSSRLNDIIGGQTGGFDCRGLQTELVSLDDPSLSAGVLSQSTTRVGSLQAAAPGGGATAESLFGTLKDRKPETVKAFKEQFNEDDCQAIALRHFLTYDQDAHCGNMMVDKQGDGPGQTRLIPIDAGQSLPNPEAAKRNAAALRRGGTPQPGDLNDKELLILQLPAATKPFSGAALAAIGQLNPDKLANDLKAANDALVQQEPLMAGKVDPGAFDLVRKSAKFLKLAAQSGLTLYEISMVYGEGFAAVIDADSQAEDATLQQALKTALYLKQRNGGIEGLEAQLMQLGFTGGKTGEINELRLDQKERILKNGWTKSQWSQQYENDLRTTELADIGKYFDPSAPESAELPTLLANGFQGKDMAFLQLLGDHRRKGGDPQVIKALRGNDATLAVELKQSVQRKIGTVSGDFNLWENINYVNEVGGVDRLLATIDASFRGKPLKDQLAAFQAAERLRTAQEEYEEAGGDRLLRDLAESFLTQFPTVNAKFEQELDNWKKTPTGEQPKDPFTAKQRQLPKSKTELDDLLGKDAVKKHDSLKSLRSYFKRKT